MQLSFPYTIQLCLLIFSQDDFFHFKVSFTGGSISQFVNFFGFHSFAERGIAFYRPVFREALFNTFYALFGLNPYPFRVLQFFLLFLNSALAYYLIYKLFKDRNLSFFVAFFYAVCAAQVASLYYLAGGIQVLGATTFLLLTLILIIKHSAFSFVTFLLALGSHELTSVLPFLISALLFIQYPVDKAIRKIWQVLPFFFVLFGYLYLEIFKIGFSTKELQYQTVFNIKTLLNSYMWYVGWALGLPEMLIDFVQPGFKLNSALMRYWGNYYLIIFSAFFISLFLLITGTTYLLIKKNKLFLNKKFLFFALWFIFSLVPVILLPLHKSTQYLETGLVAFWTIIRLIILNVYRLKTARIFCAVLIISLFTLSATSAILQRTTYWAAERGKYAKQLIEYVIALYPTLPKGAIVYFENDPNYPFVAKDWGSSSKQASFILNNEDALRLIYKDPTLKVFYQDLIQPPINPENKIYKIKAKVF
ncbi:hypothetical protein KKE03_01750 [Patescibacteria group bacterium]|nr:hypothetical protein [Patescibacteria group bacterium]